MIPGRRTAEGQLVITAGPPLSTDPRMAGFAMKPTGEIYASGGQSAFTPADLFLNGEQGAWYDPSDLTTMFQDREGATPVDADGQTVGLILDKSKVGAVSLDTTGWSIVTAGDGVININGNVITITGMTTTCRVDIVVPNWAINDYAEMEVTATTTSGYIWLGGATPSVPVVGTKKYKKVILSTNICRLQVDSGSNTFTVNLRSKIVGNHAVAPSDAARPLYKTDGTYHWLQFDGVDDSLSSPVDPARFSTPPLFTHVCGMYRESTTNNMLLAQDVSEADKYFGVMQTGQTQTANARGDSTFRVNRVAIPGAPNTSRGQLDVAVGSLTKKVVSATELTLINWDHITLSGYTSFNGACNFYGVILRGAQSTENELIETEDWMNTKTGAY